MAKRISSSAAAGKTSQGIYLLIRGQILDGTLAAGAALPSTRALAEDLAVSRSTVTTVYEQLAAEGYLETHLGKRANVATGLTKKAATKAVAISSGHPREVSAYGKRIAAYGAATSSPVAIESLIDFQYGALAALDFPLLAWRRAYNRVLVQRQRWMAYDAPEGERALRDALRGYLRRARGLQCDAEQIIIVQGSQQAIDLCARVLVDPKDRVVVEDPCYAMARRVFEAADAQVIALPVDGMGLDTRKLTRKLPTKRCKLVYVTPSHQFPLGAVMPIQRRKDLLAWAVAQNAWVIEDDYDGEFRYGMRPVDTLQSIDDSAGVIYVGTFSKALSPQLRLGYLVLPPDLVPLFREAKRLVDRHGPRQEQLVLASMIEGGSYERHVRRCRRLNEQRREALLKALETHLHDAVDVDGAASGLHIVVWCSLIPATAEAAFAAHAQAHGVGIRPLSPLYASPESPRQRPCAGYVLGYASISVKDITEGVRRLSLALKSFPQAAPSSRT